jgi:GAF domain-containing protein
VAKQMTTLLDAHLCVISDYDPVTRRVTVRAEYDDVGNRHQDTMTYTLSQFPMARRAIEDHESITINVSDPHADPAEVAIMRRDGDKCLLILPMVHQGQSIGLIEVLDHQRERKFSRQEMRLANAVAAQAAVAVHNATVFAQLTRSDKDALALRHAIETISAGYATLHDQTAAAGVLQAAAEIAAQALGAISCVASHGGESAGASGLRPGDQAAQSGTAHVIVSSAPCGDGEVALTLTLGGDAGDGQAELLGLIATMAAGAIAGARS